MANNVSKWKGCGDNLEGLLTYRIDIKKKAHKKVMTYTWKFQNA